MMDCVADQNNIIGALFLAGIAIFILGVMLYSLASRTKTQAHQIKVLSNLRLLKRR